MLCAIAQQTSSSSRPSQKHRSDRHSSTDEKEETNLITFSYSDHKSELTKVLLGFRRQDQLIDDTNDFWLFVGKYENLLKKSGQCILADPSMHNDGDPQISRLYNKAFHMNISLTVKFDELIGRLSSSERTKITSLKLRQFVQIIQHYLDFRQKEKLAKLQKLRRAQANLPVAQYRHEIIEAIQNEQVVFIAGDTGCGKSTQIPQYLHEAGYQSIGELELEGTDINYKNFFHFNVSKFVLFKACTQPRRIACISLSKRVSHEMLCEYGTKVGYQIRFERNKSSRTKIVFITEGLLLRQVPRNIFVFFCELPKFIHFIRVFQLSTEAILSQYDVIVLDEVHERHLHGDFLLGLAKCLLKIRPELKLILMSATINVKLFADYFSDEKARIIEVPGRLYPIKLHYMPQVQDHVSGIAKTERLSPEPFIQIMQLIDNKYPSKLGGWTFK